MMVINRFGLLSVAALAVCSAGLSAQLTASGGRTKTITGQTSPMPASINRELGLQWMRDAGPIASGHEGSHAGQNVAPAGDVNGDGHQDLLVAAFGTGDNAGPGSVTLLFGGPDKGTYSLSGEVPTGTRSGSSGGSVSGTQGGSASAQAGFQGELGAVTFLGVDDGDRTGAGLAAAGDMNGDGFDDFLIGAPYADGDAGADTGAVWLVYGAAEMNPVVALGSLAPGQATLMQGRFADDRLGLGLAGGMDLNADGHDDIAMGAYWASTDGQTSANGYPLVSTFPTHNGMVYVVLGDGAPMGDAYDLDDVRSDGVTLVGANAGDTFGRTLAAAGDVNGDGFDDLLISAHNADPQGIANAGAAFLMYGDDALASVMDMSDNHAGVTCFEGDQEWGKLGSSLAAGGDVDGDGFDDLLLGAPGWDVAGFGADSNEGRAYLVLGGSSTPGSMAINELGAVIDTERTPGQGPAGSGPGRVTGMDGSAEARNFGGMIMSGELPGHAIGAVLSMGRDTNGDGLSEMLIGGEGASRTYLVHGAPALPLELALSDLGALGAVLVDQDGNAQSAALVGDMNADRYSEIVIGNPSAASGAGQVQIVDGGAHSFIAVGELERGKSFDMVMHGTPGQKWLLMVSASKRAEPEINGKGTWWLGDSYFEVLAGFHDANGETVHQVNVPNSPIFEGVTVHWQTLEAPQGRHQDLSSPLTTTIQ